MKKESFTISELTRTGKITIAPVAELPFSSGSIQSLAFSPDGLLLAGAGGIMSLSPPSQLIIWDAITWQQKARVEGAVSAMQCVAFSPKGIFVATCGSSESFARLWKVDTLENVRCFKIPVKLPVNPHFSPPNAPLEDVCFSPQGDLAVTTHWDNTARLWDVATGVQIQVLRGHSSTVESATFSPNGNRLATGATNAVVYVWDTTTGEKLLELTATHLVRRLAFTADARFLIAGTTVTGFRGDLMVWDTQTWQLKYSLATNQCGVQGLAVSPDGTLIATSGSSKHVQLWDISSGKIGQIKGFPDQMSDVAFSPNGKTLACSYRTGVVIVDVERKAAKSARPRRAL